MYCHSCDSTLVYVFFEILRLYHWPLRITFSSHFVIDFLVSSKAFHFLYNRLSYSRISCLIFMPSANGKRWHHFLLFPCLFSVSSRILSSTTIIRNSFEAFEHVLCGIWFIWRFKLFINEGNLGRKKSNKLEIQLWLIFSGTFTEFSILPYYWNTICSMWNEEAFFGRSCSIQSQTFFLFIESQRQSREMVTEFRMFFNKTN